MHINKLPGPFGVAVTGIDLSQDMSDKTMRQLISLLHENQILLIKGQTLADADYVKFGYFWGKPLAFTLKSHTRDDFPEMIKISNRASTPARYRDGAVHWHSDSTYEEIPGAVTMLYGIEAPATGGETMLASTAHAYNALPEALKLKIDDVTASHCLGGSPALPGENIPFIPEETARLGIVKHKLVARHPVTGRKSLFPSGTAFGVEGWDRDEGRALILELREHITKPEFTIKVKVEKGSIFLWDNYQTLHTATPIEYSDDEGKRRLLYRISTKGIPELCRPQMAA
jgi:taurine dioxygenase